MRRFILLIAALLVACDSKRIATVERQSARIAELEKENKELRARLEALPQTVSLELQEKCAKQARAKFIELGMDKEQKAGLKLGRSAEFTSHYSAKLGRCFVLIEHDAQLGEVGWTYKNVFDAYERRAYGDYVWHTDKVKKYWEQPPMVCKAFPLSGPEVLCKDSEEFDSLMEAVS